MKTVRVLLVAFLILCLSLALASCGGKSSAPADAATDGAVTSGTATDAAVTSGVPREATPPVYEGISLRGDANVLRYGLAPRLLAADSAPDVATSDVAEPDASAPAVEGDYYDGSSTGAEPDPFDPDAVPLEEKAADTLEVEGGASDIFYAEKNQNVFVVIRLSNPDSYEIQSFTLNGVKYANYMFEKGSDMENLILKVNVGDAAGIVEYTLDAIKYIDGTEIKDVRLDGERTVRAGVRTDDQMAVALGEPATTLRSVSFDVNVEDKYGLIESTDGYLKALLYDGETILEKDLSLGESAVVFDGLTPNTAYQYAVAAYYDDLGGEGAALHTLAKKAVRTDAILLFRDAAVTQTSITWDYLLDDELPDLAVSKLELCLDGEKVGEPDAAAKSADGLLSDRAYTVVAHYDGLDGRDETISFTVKTAAKQAPTLSIQNAAATQTAISFETAVTDADQVGAISKVELLHGDDATIAEDLSVRSFENLLSNNDYSIRVTYTFDLGDGAGEQTLVKTKAVKTVAKQAPTLSIQNAAATQTAISFETAVTDADQVGAISKIELLHGNDATVAEDLSVRSFEDLLSNNDYSIRVTYTFDLNDGAGEQTLVKTKAVKTAAKQAPTVSVTALLSSQTEIAGSLTVSDPDGICSVDEVALYKGDDKVRSTDERSRLVFAGLQSGSTYRISVTFSYDLNDGDGAHETTWSVDYPTLVDSIAVDEMVLLNNNVVKHGEELNLRVYFVNPSEIEITAIYVNGQPVTVVGGDRIESAIIKFVPEEIGLIDFAVDRIDYTYQNFSVSQAVDSDVSVQYPIFGDLEISYTPVTSLFYDNSGDGVYLSFENEEGYTVYAVNGSADFVRFADGQYYVPANAVSSIEYGYENFGHTTQTCSYQTSAVVSVGKNYQKISTAEEFFAMTNGYYYLTDDLDLRNASLTQPIAFTGVLLGNGHKIRGLSNVIDTSKTDYYNVINSGWYSVGTFYDVSFTELYISVNATSDKRVTISPLGGARLVNCTVRGDIIGNQYVTVANLTGVQNSSTFNVNITLDGKASTLKYTAEKTLEKNAAVTVDENGAITCTLPNGKVYFFYTFDTELTTFTAASEVFAVGDGALKNCPRLTEVTIPETVRCGSGVLGECPLVRATLPVFIVNSLSSATKQSLEELTITGKGAIGYYAFEDCTGLTSVTIGNGVTSIGLEAFYNCSGLTGSLVIPDSVKSIGNWAFSGCSGLTGSLAIPDSVTSIGNGAFDGCSGLTGSLVIPDSVTSIGWSAFSGCSNLTSITIPDSVTSIGDNAFYNCSGLTGGLAIPDSVTSIGSSAFYGCSGLTSVTIGNGVTSIGNWAFYGCSGLTSVYYTGDIAGWCGITFGYSAANPLDYAHNLYLNGTLLTELVIPDTVTAIKEYAFSGCSGLTSIIIPDSVTSIGNSAFSSCSGLTSVTIGDGVTSIGNYAFYNCSGLTSVTIGNGVTIIGNNAFNNCSKLTSVYYTGDIAGWCGITFRSYDVNPLSYAHNLYLNGALLTELVIPDTVTAIKEYAFYGCSGLTSVTIGNGVTSIGYEAFYNCSGLTSVTIPDSVTSIGNVAFSGCSGLTSVTIPDSVTSIGEQAFYRCSKLTSITFTGTKAQWNAISKGSDWNTSTGNYTIHCTDGDIAK